LTGLSGAGKTTLARQLESLLRQRGQPVEVLDGDVIRTNLSKGLGFSKEDRDTHIRRVGYVCQMLSRNGVVAIAAAISPYRSIRDELREQIGRFVEVYVRCSLEELKRRDVKGLYAKALAGTISNFTGVSDPYEEPLVPDVVVDTGRESVTESVARIMAALQGLGYLAPPSTGGPFPATALPPAGLPHGGVLVNRLASEQDAAQLGDLVRSMPCLELSSREASDIEMLAIGGYSPLNGFMNRRDYLSVRDEMRLANGLVWSVPVVLGRAASIASTFSDGSKVALWHSGQPLAVLDLVEQYEVDPMVEARRVYGTTDAAHPGVHALFARGKVLIAGPVTVLRRQIDSRYAPYTLTPQETRAAFASRGWQTIVGFQTRNPIHRAHEYLQKCALESVDGMLLHPIVGETKEDDIPAAVRMKCYEVLLERYYPPERVVLAVNPAAMLYAGPREAIFHALIRKNYGCTHFIVGRDHAGVGNYYGTYDAQKIFDGFAPTELGITPLKFEHAFFCRACAGMASSRTCPHGDEQRVILSGTRVRAMLQAGDLPPAEFSRPEVSSVLMEAAKPILKGA